MARAVLSSRYAVMFGNYCVQGIRFRTRRPALLMPHLLVIILRSKSESLGSVALGSVPLEDLCTTESRAVLQARSVGAAFPWHPGVKEQPGAWPQVLLQTQFQCHRKKAERKFNLQELRTLHSGWELFQKSQRHTPFSFPGGQKPVSGDIHWKPVMARF